ncbi:hypothetical protein B0T25DRAFT_118029 [Lasiosphaeria hispida]|uniref:Uncharacterized protein n=1 Tax=Lasiosphaeria hispida TaxID=260671 RepID=A0AAJ0MI87_9PEZI|nr:hypothetical protein B0T25DRAFT_118029 [Lasiosphaeria hispida]
MATPKFPIFNTSPRGPRIVKHHDNTTNPRPQQTWCGVLGRHSRAANHHHTTPHQHCSRCTTVEIEPASSHIRGRAVAAVVAPTSPKRSPSIQISPPNLGPMGLPLAHTQTQLGIDASFSPSIHVSRSTADIRIHSLINQLRLGSALDTRLVAMGSGVHPVGAARSRYPTSSNRHSSGGEGISPRCHGYTGTILSSSDTPDPPPPQGILAGRSWSRLGSGEFVMGPFKLQSYMPQHKFL